jgi:hypothetical protein
VIDRAVTDELGRATLHTEIGAHVTAYLRRTPPGPGDAPPRPPSPSLAVTTLAPEPGSEIVLTGAAFHPTPSAGTLTISSSRPLIARWYDIEVGCTRTTVDRLPITIEIPTACLGTDTNLDVLIQAWGRNVDGNYQILGYSGSRLAMSTGVASFDVTDWETTSMIVPLELVGVDPGVRVSLRSDGLEFDDDLANSSTGRAPIDIPRGFPLDGITVRAYLHSEGSLGLQIGTMIRDVVGVPSVVHIDATDFLTALPVVGGPPRLSKIPFVEWSAAPVDADAIYINSDLGAVGWIVVMPPSAGETTLPEFELDQFGFHSGGRASYYDASQLHGFSEFVAQGLHFEVTLPLAGRLVIPPAGELRFH